MTQSSYVEYGKLPLQKDAFCVNVGNSIEKRWYAAEHLEILPWQVVRGQLPPVYAGEMVKLAKRTPEQNKAAIGKSFEHLKLDKIGKAASYHEVKRMVQPDSSSRLTVPSITDSTSKTTWLHSRPDDYKLRFYSLIVV